MDTEIRSNWVPWRDAGRIPFYSIVFECFLLWFQHIVCAAEHSHYHILMGSPLDSPTVLNRVCFSRTEYKGGRKQLLPLCCFSTKRGANKQINNHNGTLLTAQLYNGKNEMAAACVIALPASHNIHTTTCYHDCCCCCCCNKVWLGHKGKQATTQ